MNIWTSDKWTAYKPYVLYDIAKISVPLKKPNSTDKMENYQIIAETGSALGAINLQDTIQVPPETQNENLNDSLLDLSEVQLQQHLDSQINEPDTEGVRQNPPTHNNK